MAVHDTKEALLDAAESLFSERGYDTVGIREIAERAGVNIAGIQYHFGGKRELYVQVVRRTMRHHGTEEIWALLEGPTDDRRAAAVRFARFVTSYLQRILIESEQSACLQLMQRELAQPSEALDAVVEDFVTPSMRQLAAVLAAIAPWADEERVPFLCHCVLGQVFHYKTHRPILERLSHRDLDDTAVQVEIAEQIIRFSLRGLRCEEEFIDTVLDESHDAAPRTTAPTSRDARNPSEDEQ